MKDPTCSWRRSRTRASIASLEFPAREPRLRRVAAEIEDRARAHRHEQAAAFMAATYGRLTGKPGVCITTLGPGALNLTTGAAYALLGAMPMIAITGQKGSSVATKRASRSSTSCRREAAHEVVAPDRLRPDDPHPGPRGPSGSRRRATRPGAPRAPGGHRRAEECESIPLVPPHPQELPVANATALDRAASLITKAERPLIMLGAAASRPRSTSELAQFVLRTKIPFFTTQMGKGTVPAPTSTWGPPRCPSATTCTPRSTRRDLIVTIGRHDESRRSS